MVAKFFSNMATVLAILLVVTVLCGADVVVMDQALNRTLDVMADMPSTFGPQLSMIGMKGILHLCNPLHACGPVHAPPSLPEVVTPPYRRWVALVHRSNCSYVEKVANAQAAGYSAVIVMNIGSDFIETMSAADGTADNITIPSVFIGQSDGDSLTLIIKDYQFRFGVILTGQLPFNIQTYLLPFAITVAICFIGMLICMVVKCVRDYRRSLRHRLSWRALRRLPLHKFKNGDPYEVCAICLEDYMEGDKLRVLPCNHAYHSRCIDPWLTKRRRVCPVCKQKVRVGGETVADDTSDDDIDTERSTSERAPLLQQATQVSAGTFTSNRENPFQRALRRGEERRQRGRDRSDYNRLDDDSIENASDLSSDSVHSNRVAPSPSDLQNTNGQEEPAAASNATMIPGDDDTMEDDLDVVTITRSVKKKKSKKKKNKKSKRDDSEEGELSAAPVEDGDAATPYEGSDFIVQVDPEDNNLEQGAGGISSTSDNSSEQIV